MAKEKDRRSNTEIGLSRTSGWYLSAYALGLMVMPDNLSLSGRFGGHAGFWAPLILAAAVLIYCGYVNSFAGLCADSSPADGTGGGGRGYWEACLVYYTLVVRILASVILATGLTVSSGYVFNEVFAYWFPNFAFAYLLLAGLAGMQFLGKAHRRRAQIAFVGVVLLGLAALAATGLTTSLFQDGFQAHGAEAMGISGLFLPLLFLLGFDMAIFPSDDASGPPPATARTIKSTVAVFGGVMAFWLLSARLHVDGGRLAGTPIAHLIAAREIGGQAGRLIMGAMIIAGTCAAINALYESVARLTAGGCRQGLLPPAAFLPQAMILIAAAAAVVAMAGGLAGDERLETLIRAVLLLWLGKYGLVTVFRLLPGRPAARPGPKRFQLLGIAAVTFGGLSVLTLTDAQAVLIVRIMAITIGAVLLTGAAREWFARRSG